jgi:hypothetical protein
VVNETRGKNGTKKFGNEVAWARNYLGYEDIIDKTVKRGIWKLTDKGKLVNMTDALASQIFFKWVEILKNRRMGLQEPDIHVAYHSNIGYTKDDFLKEVFMSEEKYRSLKNLLLRKRTSFCRARPVLGKHLRLSD